MKIRDFFCILFHKNKLFGLLAKHGLFNNLSDEMFLKIAYRLNTKKKLNLKKPTLFNEKLQWLKLNNRKDIYTLMADKYEGKKIAGRIIGEEHIIPTIGIYESIDEIDFNSLPNSFVMKCTHDSGSVFLCKDKRSIDINLIRKYFNKKLKRNYFLSCREWPYKNIKPRIIVEEYMNISSLSSLDVYKIFTFSGEPYLIQFIKNDKRKDETIDYYDIYWNKLDLHQNFPNSFSKFEKPQKLDEMLEMTKKLSNNEPFIRIDFYIIDNIIYFSEFTFYSDAGFAIFSPEKWDKILGEKIKLPVNN